MSHQMSPKEFHKIYNPGFADKEETRSMPLKCKASHCIFNNRREMCVRDEVSLDGMGICEYFEKKD